MNKARHRFQSRQTGRVCLHFKIMSSSHAAGVWKEEMKKLIILLFVSLFSINVYSADVRSLHIQDFKLDSKITSTLVEKTKKIEELHIYQENNDIYVLGWSKDGKIAFIENRGIDGRGGHDFLFTIQDLVEDKICCYKKIECYDFDESSEYDAVLLTLQECINNHAEELNEKLNKYGIIVKPSEVRFFPLFDKEKNEIKFDVNVIKKGIGKYGLTHMTYEIFAVKNNTYKILGRKDDVICEYVLPTGYIKSPYEDRIALIAADAEYVYEGEEVFINFYGCNLNAGFEKKSIK